ncbi:MAG: glycosyltransferase [bacterium]
MENNKLLKCSIGIMAYNEEKNIKKTIESAAGQKIISGFILEIIVIASGCTDNTVNIVKNILPEIKTLKLLIQEKRQGKASAINLFIKEAAGDILILQNADNIPEENAFESLIKPFLDPKIGMTGGHPVPINPRNKFMGYVAHLQWQIHHNLNKESVKLGELIAFRNVVKKIPDNTAVDEISLEAEIKKQGFNLAYAPGALVINKGPETVKDFLKQRRRIFAGHLQVKKSLSYEASSMNPWRAVSLTFREFNNDRKHMFWILGAVFLEMLGRLLGVYDFYIKKKNPVVWDMIESTKELNSN